MSLRSGQIKTGSEDREFKGAAEMSNCGSSLGLKIVENSKSILLPPAAVGFHRYYSYVGFQSCYRDRDRGTGLGQVKIHWLFSAVFLK